MFISNSLEGDSRVTRDIRTLFAWGSLLRPRVHTSTTLPGVLFRARFRLIGAVVIYHFGYGIGEMFLRIARNRCGIEKTFCVTFEMATVSG